MPVSLEIYGCFPESGMIRQLGDHFQAPTLGRPCPLGTATGCWHLPVSRWVHTVQWLLCNDHGFRWIILVNQILTLNFLGTSLYALSRLSLQRCTCSDCNLIFSERAWVVWLVDITPSNSRNISTIFLRTEIITSVWYRNLKHDCWCVFGIADYQSSFLLVANAVSSTMTYPPIIQWYIIASVWRRPKNTIIHQLISVMIMWLWLWVPCTPEYPMTKYRSTSVEMFPQSLVG